MKAKLIIGLLSLATVSSTSYALIEQQQYHKERINTDNTISQYTKELATANNTISQYDKKIEEESNNYNELLEKISVLEEQLTTLNSNINTKTNNTQNQINLINNNITDINQKINDTKDISIIGKWKQTTITTDGDGNRTETNFTYEFKEDGTFFIDDKLAGVFGDKMLKFDNFNKLGIYDIINNKLYITIKIMYIYGGFNQLYILEKI